ncbi:MAG: ATP-binding response regulator [Microcoleaceae cyanobacterium]
MEEQVDFSAVNTIFYMPPPSLLQTFCQPVPVCSSTDTVADVWSVFCRESCSHIVVLDQGQCPRNLVSLGRLLAYLFPTLPALGQGNPLHLAQVVFSQGSRSSQEVSSEAGLGDLTHWQHTLERVADLILEPVRPVSIELDWSKFWTYLQDLQQDFPRAGSVQSTPQLALVNSSGRFLGLLDSLGLLQWMATHPQELSTNLTQPLHPQRQLSPFKIPDALLQLLEQFPIPLMLQLETGEVVHQNQAWQLQIGQEHLIVRETAATLAQWFSTFQDQEISAELKTRSSRFATNHFATSHRVADPLVSSAYSQSNPEAGLEQRWQKEALEDLFLTAPLACELKLKPKAKLPQWCHPGTQPDTYICVCPVPEDQERVWQFIRQPLDGDAYDDGQRGSETLLPMNTQVGLSVRLWLVMAQDITEQHRVAQELAAKNADLTQLNRLKDEFLACISHELKTPLTAVLGLSSLLKERAIGVLNDRQLRYAQLIHQSGRHLMMVVNDILDLTRMETGQLDLAPETVQIQEICDRAFEAVLKLQRRSEPAVAAATPSDPDPQRRFHLEIEAGLTLIVADELRLQQMLVNLLSNALKFTPNQGDIGLRVSHWEDWIAFTVWDTGIGIPEDKQHLIFQKFQQLESPLTRQFEGTGLGLVLTQRLARLHGGDVSFISKQGQGSEFTLLLPPSPPQRDWEPPRYPVGDCQTSPLTYARVPESGQTSPPQTQSRLVLIVEAASRFIHDLTDQLTHFGYRVVVARSGTEAVEKARRLQPRVIFLNPLLPLLSGWDVLTLLKTDPHTRQIPLIITATLGEKKRALSNHCDGFLSVPVQKSELQKILAILNPCVAPQSLQQRLTILWLNPVDLEVPPAQAPTSCSEATSVDYASAVLNHFSPCRVLEADDLDQAELIARIWHPDVTVLQVNASEPILVQFFQDFSQQSYLMEIPLITLDSTTTQMANQVENLAVFPCLIAQPGEQNASTTPRPLSSLLQAIQVAVGMTWKPNILVVDLGSLADLGTGTHPNLQSKAEHHEVKPPEIDCPMSSPDPFLNCDPTSRIDRALVQYLQTAGFRGSMSHSWMEVLQQIQCQSVDLLLICARDSTSEVLVQKLASLQEVRTKPPIIIFDQSNFRVGISESPDQETSEDRSELSARIQHLVDPMKIKIFPSRISMVELLEQLKQSLGLRRE